MISIGVSGATRRHGAAAWNFTPTSISLGTIAMIAGSARGPSASMVASVARTSRASGLSAAGWNPSGRPAAASAGSHTSRLAAAPA